MSNIKLISMEEAETMSSQQIDSTIDRYLLTLVNTYGMDEIDATNMIGNIINLITIHLCGNLYYKDKDKDL
jgi:hypothetical protein